MAVEPSKHVNGRMWPPGVSGNPNGRPVGSRTNAHSARDFVKMTLPRCGLIAVALPWRRLPKISLACFAHPPVPGYYRMTFGLRSSSPCPAI